jgi:ubiquinone/menaquinone biosynthesis C-methylase UbiE
MTPTTRRPSAPSETQRFYDQISGAYDVLADSSEHEIREIGIQAVGVSPGQTVLEIGCGTGHGLLSLARAVGPSGEVYGVDISAGMIAVARRHIELAGLQNVTLTMGDARLLAFRSNRFDAVFMSFALELFESAMPQVLAEVRRVLRSAGRVGVVAMAEGGQSNAMTIVYNWAHRRWPHVVDCRPIDLTGALQAARFQTRVAAAATIWGLPVVAAIGLKAVDKDGAGR